VDAASTWNSLPPGLERWTRANAALAVLGAAASLACDDPKPSLLVAASSLAWASWQYAPRGVSIANAVTACRLWLFGGTLSVAPQYPGWIALTAGAVFALDGLDGWIARRRGEASTFGAQFDMETDSHLVMLLCLYLVVHNAFAPWVLGMGALRYVYVLLRWRAGPSQVRERRSNWSRWVFSFAFASLTLACIPSWSALTRPLLALASAALGCSFAPDFLALRRRSPAPALHGLP
jgi:phosphatidylglycerophosphate synthase